MAGIEHLGLTEGVKQKCVEAPDRAMKERAAEEEAAAMQAEAARVRQEADEAKAQAAELETGGAMEPES